MADLNQALKLLGNPATEIAVCSVSFIVLTSKLIRGDESAENQNGTSSPSDGASCSESLERDWDCDENRIITRSSKYPEWVGQTTTQVIKGISKEVDELARSWKDHA